MSVPAMNHRLRKFMLEVRTKSGKEYCLDSLYQLCCGLFIGVGGKLTVLK